MNYQNVTYAQALTYSRGSTKVEALLSRLDAVTETIETPIATPASLAKLNREMCAAKRAFDANSRMLDSVDSLIDQLY